jgi:hypothetical protein
VAAGVRGHPIAAIASLWLLGAAIVFAIAAARRRHSAAAVGAVIVALVGVWSLAARLEGRTTECVSLEPFARAVVAETRVEDPVFFFPSALPAVALYARRVIPTLRDPGHAPADRAFYLIVPESRLETLPPAWRASAQTIRSARARVFTRRLSTVHLLRIPPSEAEAPTSPRGADAGVP